MSRIIACIDGSIYSHSVADHAAWAAKRLSASVELLQVLGRREAGSSDLSGNIAADAQATLLAELAALDAERAKLIQKRGRLALDDAKARIELAGTTDVTSTLRHGDLLDTLAEKEATADLIVIGKRGEAADFAKGHLGSNFERVVRASHKPILVAARAFKPITKALIAFDGGASALKAVDQLSRSPLLAGVMLHLVTVGDDQPEMKRKLESAVAQLKAGGHQAELRFVTGQPDKAIAAMVEQESFHLLIMGAYGHSRIRSLMIGSTTTELIRSCKVPVLLYR
ncbi:MAG: universal stress protein [Bosea sp. (in: a-proteobacteria)]